jgi:putative spermidine/putrescine transport system substrate-binding protein
MTRIEKCFSLAITAVTAAALALADAAQARDLTVVGWGGAYQEAQRKNYFNPYMERTGNKLLDEPYNGEMAKIKAMVEANDVSWDVVQVEAPELVLGCEEGLFEMIDWSKVGGKDRFIPEAVSDCGVGTIVWSVVLAYDGDKLKDGPKTWADFWNVEKFPGKRALRKGAKFTLEIALLADGVPIGDVYKVLGTKEGVDRAFRKLDQIKSHMQWWEAGAQPPQWLAAGDVVMTSAYNGRISAANKEGRKFKIVWDGQVFALDSWVVVKGSPNVEKAYAFISLASEPETQAALSAQIPYGTTNAKAVAAVDPKVATELPTAPANLKNALANNTEFWVENLEDLTQRFNAWVAK